VDTDNNSGSDIADVGRIDLSIDKSHQADLTRGGSGSYEIEVSNEGTDQTDGATRVTDTLPAGVSFAGASGAGWNCSFSSGTVECLHPGSIAGGTDAAPITLDVDVAAGAPSQVTNTATVSTSDDSDSSNDSDSDIADVTGGLDAAVSITPTGQFRVGSQANYRVTVRNSGPAALGGPVVATVDLPAGLSFVDADGPGFDCTAAGQQVTCTDADGMATDSRSDIALEVDVAKGAMPGVNTPAAVEAPGDANAANDSDMAPTTVSMIDLAVAMQHSGTFGVGAASLFTINVENVGTADTISPVRIVDVLPNGLAFNGGSGTGWSCQAFGQLVICTLAAGLPAGQQAEPLALSVTPSAGIGGQTIANEAIVQTTDDGESANDADTDTVAIGAAPVPAQTPANTGSGQAAGAAKSCKRKKKGKKGAAAAKKTKKCKRKKK
jgi:large repetitive protein